MSLQLVRPHQLNFLFLITLRAYFNARAEHKHKHKTHMIGERSKYVYARIALLTRIMVTIKKRAGVIPYSFSSSIALLSSLLSCSFYLLDLRTISSVDILEMT